ncbi:unnamed protein product, partial [Prorocentrum cordatum]
DGKEQESGPPVLAVRTGRGREDAVHTLEIMLREGSRPNTAARNAAASACLRGARWRLSLRILDSAGRGFKPDQITCNVLVNALGKGHDWPGALGMLEEMSRKSFGPDIFGYGAAVDACGNAARWDKALGILGSMRDRSVAADAALYNAALGACSRAQKGGLALRLLEDMSLSAVPPDAVSFGSAIGALRRSREWATALHLVEVMRLCGVRPDGRDHTVQPEVISNKERKKREKDESLGGNASLSLLVRSVTAALQRGTAILALFLLIPLISMAKPCSQVAVPEVNDSPSTVREQILMRTHIAFHNLTADVSALRDSADLVQTYGATVSVTSDLKDQGAATRFLAEFARGASQALVVWSATSAAPPACPPCACECAPSYRLSCPDVAGATIVHLVSSWCSHVVTFLLGVLIGSFVLPVPLSCEWLVGGLSRGRRGTASTTESSPSAASAEEIQAIAARQARAAIQHRITLFEAPPSQAVIVTVDGDVYLETVVVNADCEEARPLRGLGAPLYGVAEANVYRFRGAPSAAELWGHLRDGAPLLGAALPPSPFALAGGAGAGAAWVPQALVLDDPVGAADLTATPRGDWPITGPRTTQRCLDHAGGPLAWHSKWKAEARLRDSDAICQQHALNCRLLETATCYDQPITAELAAFELVCRQAQLIEERHYENTVSAQVAAEDRKDKKKGFGASESLFASEAKRASEAKHDMGAAASKGNLCISPALAEFIAEQLKAEAAVAKGRRKAREERAARA